MAKPQSNDSIKINATPSKKYGKFYEGHFYKINACGSYEVQINGNDPPCNGKYEKCVSYDRGACIQIVKLTKTRYFVIE